MIQIIYSRFLLVAANAGQCLRHPYNMLILAAGHYRKRQKNYIVAAGLNIVVSVVTVKVWGLIGVAIGLLIAMFYQTVWMAVYDSRYFIRWPLKNFFKQICIDALTVAILVFATWNFKVTEVSYLTWILQAILVSFMAAVLAITVNFLFYKSSVIKVWKGIMTMIRRNSGGDMTKLLYPILRILSFTKDYVQNVFCAKTNCGWNERQVCICLLK